MARLRRTPQAPECQGKSPLQARETLSQRTSPGVGRPSARGRIWLGWIAFRLL